MAAYLSLPAFQELIEFVENDSVYEDSVKALANSMLSYYFPLVNGWIIAPEQNRNNTFADFIVLRVTTFYRRPKCRWSYCSRGEKEN